jgi:hypothetical protein
VFRLRLRVELIERLVLKHALFLPVAIGGMPIVQSQQELTDLLKGPSNGLEAVLHKRYGYDAATIALFSEEAREVIQSMTETVDECAADMKKLRP